MFHLLGFLTSCICLLFVLVLVVWGADAKPYKLAHSKLSALPSIALLKRYFSYTCAKKSTLSEALCRGGDVGSAIGMLNEIAQRKA